MAFCGELMLRFEFQNLYISFDPLDFAPSYVAMEIVLKASTLEPNIVFKVLSFITENHILESEQLIAKTKSIFLIS